MPIEFIPVSKTIRKLNLEPNGKVQKFFTNECARYMDKYVPFDTGALAETVLLNGEPTVNVEDNKITYDQEYARIVYYGIRNGKEINIHTDKHAFATTYWDKVMWTAEGKDIEKSVQDFVNRGGK